MTTQTAVSVQDVRWKALNLMSTPLGMHPQGHAQGARQWTLGASMGRKLITVNEAYQPCRERGFPWLSL
eukprot:7761452-Prorocentrum_lima.AAC.1